MEVPQEDEQLLAVQHLLVALVASTEDRDLEQVEVATYLRVRIEE